MAQVCGGTLYDFEWQYLLQNVLPRLQLAADRWAAQGPNALNPERVGALVIRLFVFRDCNNALLRGPLDASLGYVRTIEQELQRFSRKLILQDLYEASAELSETIHTAAKSWSEGDPESPRTEAVLNWFVAVLFNYRLVSNPPKPIWPKHSILA